MNNLFKMSFFHDQSALAWWLGLWFLTVLTLIIQVIGIEAQNFPVPVAYSDFNPSLIINDNWQQLLDLPALLIAMNVVNSIVAVRLHTINQLYAQFVIAFSYVLTILLALVSWSVTDLA